MEQQGARKSADKQDQVYDHICRLIRCRALRPGDPVPTRKELERLFGINVMTVQRAFSRLIEDGFVYSRTRLGTFVCNYPPNLFRYALSIPVSKKVGQYDSCFWTVMERVGRDPELQLPLPLTIYSGIDILDKKGDYLRLLDDVLQHRVAGIIFATSPWLVEGTPILTQPEVARVGVMPSSPYPIARVEFGQEICERAIETLFARGRRRIAALFTGDNASQVPLIAQALRERGLAVDPALMQASPLHSPEWAGNLCRLLWRSGERPDGLFISDDNLLPFAVRGLVEAGVRPEELTIISHANFPSEWEGPLPVIRVGYDLRELMRICVDSLNKQIRGEPVQSSMVVQARFEDELTLAH